MTLIPWQGLRVECDGCGNEMEDDNGNFGVLQADETDRIAEWGWDTRDGKHYCGECIDKQLAAERDNTR